MATQLLTEEQAKQAAHKYCELAKLDPEQLVPAAAPISQVGGLLVSHTIHVTQPLWRSVAARIIDAGRIQQATNSAKEITDGNTIG